MDIIIDSEKIAFELEKENNIGEVIHGITSWLNENGRLVISTQIDGIKLKDNQLTQDIPLDGELSFNTAPYRDIMITSLKKTEESLSLFSKAVEKNNIALIKKMLNPMAIISDLQTFLPSPEIAILEKQIKHYLSLNKPDETVLIEAQKSLIQSFTVFRYKLIERINEFIQPVAELQKVNLFLKKINENIEQIPVNLQTGKAAEAINEITQFTEAIEKFNRTLFLLPEKVTEKQLIGDMPLDKFLEELMPILSELAEGFNNNDIILIGDLMEYEIAPRLKNIINFIDSVAKID